MEFGPGYRERLLKCNLLPISLVFQLNDPLLFNRLLTRQYHFDTERFFHKRENPSLMEIFWLVSSNWQTNFNLTPNWIYSMTLCSFGKISRHCFSIFSWINLFDNRHFKFFYCYIVLYWAIKSFATTITNVVKLPYRGLLLPVSNISQPKQNVTALCSVLSVKNQRSF